jgi:hypothetical protein
MIEGSANEGLERRALLRGFHSPGAPIELKPWKGSAEGPGIYFIPGTPEDPAGLAAGYERIGPGAVRFPFDPERAVAELVFEERFRQARPWHSYFPAGSHVIPVRMRKMLLRRRVRWGLKSGVPFPLWPIEPCVENIRAMVAKAAREAGTGGEPEPFWPNGKTHAVALMHDIDDVGTYRRALWRRFAELEERHGLRSSWHFCSVHLGAARETLDELDRRGHEIAWHGPNHDYRIAYRKADRIRAVVEEHSEELGRYRVAGFRSPFHLRTEALYDGLAGLFSYDSSPRDTAAEFMSAYPREGCCTVFPFFRRSTVVLPVTMPEDHCAGSLAGDDTDGILRIQRAKLEWIRSVGGMATLLTHPVGWISLKPALFCAYERLVEEVARDPGAWVATAREIAEWWRARSGLAPFVSPMGKA